MATTDQWNPRLYNQKHAFIFNYGSSLIDLLAPKKNETILDIGCGAGQLTNQLSKLAQEVVGLDKSQAMIEAAKSSYPTITFIEADAAAFNLGQQFDAIFSNAALHWVTQQQEAVQKMFDHLKPGGRIVLEMGGKGNIQKIVSALSNTLAQTDYKANIKNNPWYFPSISEYTKIMEDKGFTVRFAQLYDRPTVLADEQTGIKDWLSMFGGTFFANIPTMEVEKIKDNVQDQLRSTLFKNGKWTADYKRLRVIAYKETD